ncbi:MAG: hypothetical protein MI919_10250, partial [Holophagales bacterium]|nr:hypothetical protein [Holophagales bacterium]
MRFFKSSAERAAEKAEGHLRDGRYPKAAELFLKAGRPAEAAAIYEEHLGDIDRAAEAWEKADEPAKAGELLFTAGRHRDAVSRFQAAGLPKRAAEACVEDGQAVRAGGFFEQAGLFDRAADCYVEGGEVERALDALEKEAESLKQRSGSHPEPGLERRLQLLDHRRLELFGRLERHHDAARLLLGLGKAAEAAPLFEKAEDPAAAVGAYLDAGEVDEALRLTEAHPDDLPP